MTDERRGIALGLVGVIIFGLTLPASRLAVLELDPLFVACGRAVLAGFCTLAVVIVTRLDRPPPTLIVPLLRYGFGVIVAYPILMTVALRYVPAAHGGVILAILPLATAMAAVLVAGERPSPAFWACGVAGSVTVVAYVVVKAALTAGSVGDVHWADLMLLVAAACAGWGFAEGAQVTKTLGGWQAISWALVLALPVMVLATGLIMLFGGITRGTEVRAAMGTASVAAWAGFLYVGVFSMYVGFFAWNRGLALGGIARVGQMQLLMPFVTMIGATAILGETVGAIEVVFAGLVVMLVALGSRTRVAR